MVCVDLWRFDASEFGESFGNGFSDEVVAVVVEVDTVGGELFVGILCWVEEVDKSGLVLGSEFGDGFGVEFDFGLPCLVCSFDCDGGEHDDLSPGMSAAELVEVREIVLAEFGEAFFPSERFVEAVAENDGVGGPLGEEVFHVLGVAFESEAVSDFVAGPSETADFESGGIGDLKAGFEFAALKESLDHGVSVEENGGVFVGLLSESFVESF